MSDFQAFLLFAGFGVFCYFGLMISLVVWGNWSMRKQFEELHPLFDLEKDEQGEYMCVLTRVTWLGFELGKKTLQAEIDQLKTQLNNMEQCYIQLKQEHNELIAFNTEIDRKQKSAEKTTEKYKFKVSMIGDLLRDSTDQEMTLKAIRTVVDRVGEHA